MIYSLRLTDRNHLYIWKCDKKQKWKPNKSYSWSVGAWDDTFCPVLAGCFAYLGCSDKTDVSTGETLDTHTRTHTQAHAHTHSCMHRSKTQNTLFKSSPRPKQRKGSLKAILHLRNLHKTDDGILKTKRMEPEPELRVAYCYLCLCPRSLFFLLFLSLF